MARRRYLVSYDIADPNRLRKVHESVKGFGYALQYSVFICDMSDVEKLWLKALLRDIIKFNLDRVAFIDLGDPEKRGVECFEFMGVTPNLPSSGGPQIV